MTWTYGGDPAASTLAAVRFLIGDTDTNDQQLQDAEIDYAISLTSDQYGAAIFCANNLAAKFSRLTDSQIESVRVASAQAFDHYRQLAFDLKALQETFDTGAGIGTPWVGGVSISDIESNRDNTDRPAAAFTRDKFKNPPSGSDTNELFNP